MNHPNGSATRSIGSATSGGTAEWSRARARVARAHHPDLGGDQETYVAAVAQVDARFGQRPPQSSPVSVHRDPSMVARFRRAVRRTKRATNRISAALPRGVRRGRRYIEI